MDLLKTWHEHIVASRHGAMEGHESEEMRRLVKHLMEQQGLSARERNEIEADPESRRLVFWLGYESKQSPASQTKNQRQGVFLTKARGCE